MTNDVTARRGKHQLALFRTPVLDTRVKGHGLPMGTEGIEQARGHLDLPHLAVFARRHPAPHITPGPLDKYPATLPVHIARVQAGRFTPAQACHQAGEDERRLAREEGRGSRHELRGLFAAETRRPLCPFPLALFAHEVAEVSGRIGTGQGFMLDQ